ncbi:MAG TPA: hypothetical protein VLJ83_08375 [Gemmatimonadaceae bacterium]|nr:hypothetical protein [Gemmatimonadaceae bacterium]
MKTRNTFLFAASLFALAACAFPLNRRATSAAAAVNPTSPGNEAHDPGPPIVQVREYTKSPAVVVVAWEPDDNGFGLRTELRRDGSLVSDHQLYVDTYYDGGVALTKSPILRRANWNVAETLVPAHQVLLSTGVSHDLYHCFWGPCSPYEVRGIRIRDEMLRSNRDSIAVKLYGRGDADIVLTARRDLIDAYLSTVDSLSAALRNPSARMASAR